MSAKACAVMPLRGAEMPSGGPKGDGPVLAPTEGRSNAPASAGRFPSPCPLCCGATAFSTTDAGGGLWRCVTWCPGCNFARAAFGRSEADATARALDAWDATARALS